MALVIKRYDEEKPRLIPHYRKGAKLSGSVLPGKRGKLNFIEVFVIRDKFVRPVLTKRDKEAGRISKRDAISSGRQSKQGQADIKSARQERNGNNDNNGRNNVSLYLLEECGIVTTIAELVTLQ